MLPRGIAEMNSKQKRGLEYRERLRSGLNIGNEEGPSWDIPRQSETARAFHISMFMPVQLEGSNCEEDLETFILFRSGRRRSKRHGSEYISPYLNNLLHKYTKV